MSRLDWPTFLDRTAKADRTSASKYSVTLSQAFADLERELDRLGVDDYTYSFDAQQRQKDGRPYSRASPDDPGFVLRWSKDGDTYAAAADEYTSLRDNVRTVGLWLEETRKRAGRPVRTADTEFAAARLPPADGDAVAAPPATADAGLDEPPHEVLGVAPDAPDRVVTAVARRLSADVHPDSDDPDPPEYKRIQRAKRELLK